MCYQLAAIVMDFLSLVVVVVVSVFFYILIQVSWWILRQYCLRSGWHRDVSLARYFVNQGREQMFVSILCSFGYTQAYLHLRLSRALVLQQLSLFSGMSQALITVLSKVWWMNRPPRYHTGVGIPLILVIPNLVACRVYVNGSCLDTQVTDSASY